MNQSLQSILRDALGKRMRPGYPRLSLSLRLVSRQSGVSYPTLCRFLQGEDISGKSLDKIANYLKAEVDAAKTAD